MLQGHLTLETASGIADIVELSGICVLATVVMLEIIALLSKKPGLHKFSEWASLATLALYVGFYAAVHHYTKREKELLNSTVSSQQTQISSLKDQLGRSNNNLTQALTKAGELQARLDELKEPRRLIGTRRHHLISALTRQAPVDIGVASFSGDAEATAFARDFTHLFHDLGWKVQESWLVTYNFIPPGVIIEVKNPARPPVQALVFVRALREVGVEAKFSVHHFAGNSEQEFGITVGQK